MHQCMSQPRISWIKSTVCFKPCHIFECVQYWPLVTSRLSTTHFIDQYRQPGDACMACGRGGFWIIIVLMMTIMPW